MSFVLPLSNVVAGLVGSLLRALRGNFKGEDWLPAASTAANSTFMKWGGAASSSNVSGVGLQGVWVPSESINRFRK